MGHPREPQNTLCETALGIYNWFKSPTDDLLPIYKITGLVADNVLSTIPKSKVIQNLKADLQSEHFENERLLLLKNWGENFEGERSISEDTSARFLKYFLNKTNHKLLYKSSIISGQTTYRVGESLFDDIITFYDSNREAWTFHLTTEGSGLYSAGDSIYSSPGQAMLLSPKASCYFQRNPKHSQWTHYWTLFEPKIEWQELLDWPLATRGIYQLQIESQKDIKHIENIFQQILHETSNETALDIRLHSNLFEQILIQVFRSTQNNKETCVDTRVESACNYLQKHYKENVSIQDIASHCGLSESRLAHLFREQIGLSINQYKTHLRLQFSKQRLLESNESISSISDQLGFSDPAQFSKFFTKQTGKSPRIFRADPLI